MSDECQETMPNPLWPTFVSSNMGVWKGVGAAFSPITAEMEPISLGLKNEYLYDALILCTVEQIPGPESDKPSESSLYRKVMWKVGNFVGEQGFDEVSDFWISICTAVIFRQSLPLPKD
jgi:hypothetical protein